MIYFLFTSALFLVAESFATLVSAEPALVRYTCKWETSGFPDAEYWGIAMNSNGTIQAAVDDHYDFYYSNNSGLNVTQQNMSYGEGVAISDDGTYITTAANHHIFSSNDSGLTFADTFIGDDHAVGAGMSGTGKYQIISGYGDRAIWTSNNFGQTFTGHNISQEDAYGYWSAISTNGSYQVAGFFTTTSYVSTDYGQTFNQTVMNGLKDSEVSQISLSTDAKYQVLATLDQFAVSKDWGKTWRVVFDSEFYGAAISLDGQYQMGIQVNSSRSNYYLSSDYGETFYLADGMPTGMWLSYGVLSHDGRKAIVSNWDDEGGKIFLGDCGWSALNYITATVTSARYVEVDVSASVTVYEEVYV